jgi:hypothetical protein
VIEDPAEPDLASAVEWHLLEAQLAPAQRETLRRWGWFDVPWPEQVVVLRVFATSSPAVEAYQPRPHGARRAVPGASPGAYLVSWDLHALDDRCPSPTAGPLRYRCSRASPLARARLVLEAHRRGVLKDLLEGTA